jgi:lipopolysaccharide cholinephosphotransferase
MCTTKNYDYFNIKKCEYEHPILSKTDLLDLQELLSEFKNFCNFYKIKYFAIAGTLIGAVRQGGLMPLDDDIDIGIFKKDTYHFNKYNKMYKNNRYEIKPVNTGYVLYKKSDKENKVCIDIFVFELKDNKYKVINGYFENESFEIDEILPLEIYKYNNIDIYVPNKYEIYLVKTILDHYNSIN